MLEERLDRVFEGLSDETFAAPKPAWPRLSLAEVILTG
jgi:hypothetical protein